MTRVLIVEDEALPRGGVVVDVLERPIEGAVVRVLCVFRNAISGPRVGPDGRCVASRVCRRPFDATRLCHPLQPLHEAAAT
mgnify:CR=1 FL=1